MKKMLTAAVFVMLVAFSFTLGNLHADVADRIVAVVGNEVILKSEIDDRALMTVMQYPETQKDTRLKEKILAGIIDQKVILVKARIDSTQVDESTLDALTNERLKMLASRFASKEAMEEKFGKSMGVIRQEIRNELKDQQLIETLRKKQLAGITVTHEETVDFYRNHKQQLPQVSELVGLSQILKYPDLPQGSKDAALAQMKIVQAELKAGADFAATARKYSQDPGSAKLGGDLGYVQKGELVRSFEDAAFLLKDGKISDIVETRYGYHIIQRLEKKPNAVHLRHILIAYDQSKTDEPGTVQLLSRIKSDVLAGRATFADMAKKYSDDPVSGKLGGVILSGGSGKTLLPVASLRPQMMQIVGSLRNIGDISDPQKIDFQKGNLFYGIFQLNAKIPVHQLNLEQDYASLEELALEAKKQERYNEWLSQLKKEVLVRISDI
ncbi:peptidylprolyl isomerase [Chlorobium phaeobacteroides]|jgi:peptidyl-prolyl cis-trans isomerase SurA|uniref:PpiC-type peptidyl-prolyl cis-trans isomerase n=1 Tax=Chlorobium phaeobacteroides (strain DSM 266 / SMG 266 / 2430) TaxID=290317 RepID=A1BCH8_CHLPD|nr:peptidylprolyl isomerase [Chlorobium phaeobacteroides]ABL64105.1 PpiC-type peptidyl-prolyl cis-trans isomerase [Chlorobium phaeobacteroides DSM 266]MBV5319855.1 peptidylprolyl isomerase [Chlorobium phaeobacteroides]